MVSSTASKRAVAVAAAVGLGLISAFEVALALGVPWGGAAWGGAQETLPPELRTASGLAAIVWAIAVLVVLGRGGYWGSRRWDEIFRWATWLLVGLLTVGSMVNFVSSSMWERLGWGPFALVMAVLCFVLARRRGSAATA